METHIQSVEDALIESLSFRLPNSANFINDRRSVTFFPTGGNEFSPFGTKIIKFMIAGTDWLDPSTVRVQFKLSNMDPDGDSQRALQLISPLPSQFFRRLRILCGGQVVEDIDYYNRVYHMVHMMLPLERRLNDYVEGFGRDSLFKDIDAAFAPPPAIVWQGNKVVLFPLMCGLFNQSKFLPLKFLQGLQIELEVVNSYEEVCIHNPDQGPIEIWEQDNLLLQNREELNVGNVDREEFNFSRRWLITEPQIKCDVVTLDNQLDHEYTDHLVQGKKPAYQFQFFCAHGASNRCNRQIFYFIIT